MQMLLPAAHAALPHIASPHNHTYVAQDMAGSLGTPPSAVQHAVQERGYTCCYTAATSPCLHLKPAVKLHNPSPRTHSPLVCLVLSTLQLQPTSSKSVAHKVWLARLTQPPHTAAGIRTQLPLFGVVPMFRGHPLAAHEIIHTAGDRLTARDVLQAGAVKGRGHVVRSLGPSLEEKQGSLRITAHHSTAHQVS